jgi:hypothetical protein
MIRAAVRLALALSLVCVSAVQAAPPAKGKVGSLLSGNPVEKLMQALASVTLEDLQYADNIAVAQKNEVAHQCWAAWITLIKAQQSANVDANGNPIQPPTIHLFTDVERAIDLVNALQPTSPFAVACAPLANQIRMNVLQLITTAATGALLGGLTIP